MSLTKTDIINQVLKKLRSKTIASPGQQHPNAETVETYYNTELKALLEQTLWAFATETKILKQRKENPPEFEFKYSYQLPDDFVAPDGLYRRQTNSLYYSDYYALRAGLTPVDNEDGLIREDEYEVTQDAIRTNEENPKLKYIYFNENADSYQGKFVKAFVAALAATCSYAINADIQLYQLNLQVAGQLVREAVAFNAKRTKKKKKYNQSTWTDSRFRYYGISNLKGYK